MSAVYGCHNREPLRDRAVVQAGNACVSLDPLLVAKAMTVIPDPMSKDCKYTHTELGQKDAKCDGCKHRVQTGTTS